MLNKLQRRIAATALLTACMLWIALHLAGPRRENHSSFKSPLATLQPANPAPEIAIGSARGGLNLAALGPSDLQMRSRGNRDEEKMAFVRYMAAHAWKGYRRYAWGHDDLKPVERKPSDWYARGNIMLNTPVDSLDTLFLLGLKDEYNEAKELVLKKLDFGKITEHVNVFESTIRILGGLLAAYDLDGDKRLLEKATELADRFLPAFDTATGFPLNFISLSSGIAYDYHGKFESVLLAAAGSLQLEFQYLSDTTGNPKYQEAALYVYEQLQSMTTFVPGLFPDWLNASSFDAPGQSFHLGGGADSYYEYLLKLWLSTGETKFFQMYETAANSISTYMVQKSWVGGSEYIPLVHFSKDANGNYKSLADSGFPHLACFAGGMFALGAKASGKSAWQSHFDLGASITDTCWSMYSQSPTKLGPEMVNADTMKSSFGAYYLRPETVESLFYMWRFTHNSLYRERGWVIAQAIEQHCRVSSGGYHGLANVMSLKGDIIDRQESFFIAETLKYLFLLFADDDMVPLEKYVFNTEAHPLSVRGHGRRSDPANFVPLPTSYKLPVGTLVGVSPELQMKRRKDKRRFVECLAQQCSAVLRYSRWETRSWCRSSYTSTGQTFVVYDL
ncbi:glycoside hydrolase [Chytriomyces sp. MP71]|nr:glycoside hydrolase [Chytriomyces sp. MP71]